MSARPRDLLKTRAFRIEEAFRQAALRSGMADGELVAFGGNLSPHTTNTQLAVSDTCALIGGAIIDKAAQGAIAVPAGATTGANQECKVLIELDASGTITLTAGAVASTGASVRPAENPARVTLGVINVGASFTPGTTALTGLLVKEPYWLANSTV